MPTAPALIIREATAADAGLVLAFIQGLAAYEKLSADVVATEETLRATLFGSRPYAEVVIAERHGVPTGFALFFHNYSTFLARPGIYLEDLFVLPAARGAGIGKALLIYLARLAKRRGCGRFEWSVLDWNEDAIRFYEALGARALNEWTVFRVDGAALDGLAARDY